MAFPTYTNTFHNFSYPAISPARPELSTAGKIVLITGGGSGIGPRITHAFATSGATKITIIGRTESSLIATKREVEAQHPNVSVLTFVADVADRAAVVKAFESTKKTFGPINILVSNAGYLPNVEPIATGNVDEFMKGFEVNVKGNFILSQAFLANSVAKPTLIHVSTAGGHAPALLGGMGSYAASKLAAIKLMEYLALESPHVRVMNIHPGVLDTDMNKKSVEAGLLLHFDDVELAASFIVWSASPEAEFLAGKFIWSNWDVEELIAKKEELQSSSQLTIGLLGWP